MGVCEEGISTCEADGTPGPCLGEVTPGNESCATVEDEDCDGSSPPCDNLWSVSFAANADFTPAFLEADSLGNVYLAGTFTGTLNVGGADLVGLGSADIFIAKFDAQGDHVWSRSFGTPVDYLFLTGMDVDPSGNVGFCGIFYDELDLDAVTINTDTSAAFVAYMTDAGVVDWAVAAEGQVTQTTQLTFAPDGSLIYGTVHAGDIYFGGSMVISGVGTAFARYAADGANTDTVGFTGIATSLSLDTDPTGDFYILGRNGNFPDFGGGTIPVSQGLVGARLDAAFANELNLGFANNNQSDPLGMSASSGGAIAIAGNSAYVIDFSGSLVSSQANTIEGFIAVLEPTGNLRYGRFYEGNNVSETATRFVRPRFAASENVLVGGTLVADANITGSLTSPIGTDDALVIHLNDTGGLVTFGHYGGAGTSTQATALAVHADGSFLLAGTFSRPDLTATAPDFGQGPLAGGPGISGFIAKVAP